ncbi:MAG: two-component system response regulator [Bacteroidetes bacterium 4572_117]|nr:MAG: two-component system response regulator [Bacteroidetes bacterium 4572_117]
MGKNILVVDDTLMMRKLIKRFLGQFYDIKLEENGLEAILSMQNGYIPDLIISDIQMPKLDGFGFIEQVKATGFLKGIPVIMLSSIDDSQVRLKFLKLGVTDYLIKPFNPEELVIKVNNIFERMQEQVSS